MLAERELFQKVCAIAHMFIEHYVNNNYTYTYTFARAKTLTCKVERTGFEDRCSIFLWYRPFMPDGRSGCVLFFRETDYWAYRLEPKDFLFHGLTPHSVIVSLETEICAARYQAARYPGTLLEYIEDVMDGKHNGPHPHWYPYEPACTLHEYGSLHQLIDGILLAFFLESHTFLPRWDFTCRHPTDHMTGQCFHRRDLQPARKEGTS